jgi:cysteine desulfuration protein SufE
MLWRLVITDLTLYRIVNQPAISGIREFCALSEPSFDQLLDDFEFLDDWEERYKYVIELGRALEPLEDEARTPDNKVQGCASQVWLVSETDSSGANPVLTFRGDSDALIVKGLIAILHILLSGKAPRDIIETDVQAALGKLGLHEALTPQRSNGLAAMISRLKADAALLAA